MSRYRIGEWEFNSATGDLTGPRRGRRLQAYETRLLLELIGAAGQAAASQQLNTALAELPAHETDLDAAVLELRSALESGLPGDGRASIEPTDEGYRLTLSTERLSGPAPTPPRRADVGLGIAMLVVLGAITLFWFGPAGRVAERRAEEDRAREEATNMLASPAGRAAGMLRIERPLRIAVVALELPADPALAARIEDLLLALVGELGAVGTDRLGVVGPISGEAHIRPGQTAAQVGAGLGVDYALHVAVPGDDALLLELFAVPDREQLFATRFPTVVDSEVVSATVIGGVLSSMEQHSERELR